MPRCLLTVTASLALSTAFTAALPLVLLAPQAASAQYARVLPPNTLRGKVSFGQPPEAALNGNAIRLAPGVRIRGANNMLVMSGALVGQTYKVNYALEMNGLLKEVWILTDAEADTTWPETIQQAATWTYNPLTQSWTKP